MRVNTPAGCRESFYDAPPVVPPPKIVSDGDYPGGAADVDAYLKKKCKLEPTYGESARKFFNGITKLV